MKMLSLFVFASLLSASAFAQDRSERLPNLVMQPGDSYMMLDPRTHQPLRVTCADDLSGGYPQPFPRAQIEFYSSDSCNGELVAILDARRTCLQMPQVNIWGIRVNGRCYNIKDMPASQACERFKELNDQTAMHLFSSDSCNGELVAIVTERTQCQTLGTQNIWGIRKHGQCINIKDMPASAACEQFR